jgi:homoserine kinase
MKPFCIRVPGSTANLGPGFDSVGLAINRYLTLNVKPSTQWDFQYTQSEYSDLPSDENNLIYRVLDFTTDYLGLNKKDFACLVDIDCDLPLARGLGSSAAAVVAGIELANQLYELDLSYETKARIGSLYEGHPDNIGASLYGGLTIGSHSEKETFIVPWGTVPLDLLIVVPKVQLLTSVSRGQLPAQMCYRQAVEASSLANVLIAALLKGDLELAGKMMQRDLFHHPYRQDLVPQLREVARFFVNQENCGVALSGAGPSVMVFLEKGRAHGLMPSLIQKFPDCEIDCLKPVENGVEVIFIPE